MKTAPFRIKRLALLAVGALVAVALIAVLALWIWAPSGEQLARRAETEFQQRTGVELSVGEVNWSLLPAPHIEAKDVRTRQDEAIVVGRVAAWPSLSALLDGRVEIDRLEVEDAVVPRNATRAFRGLDTGMRDDGATGAVPLARVVFRNVTYISWAGVPVAYDGEIDFDPAWRPRRAELRRPGATQPASAVLLREGREDRWHADIVIGGGTATGELRLQERDDGHLKIEGSLDSKRVEIASAVDTFHRRSPVSGFASGRTVFSSEGDTPGELGRKLRTSTQASVQQAVVLRFDLDKAISSFGKERDGQTRLDSLSARVETQNTEQGMRVRYEDIRAVAGKYTGRGEAVVYQKQVDAKGSVDIVDGLVGLPFTLKGPTSKPDFSVPKGFIAGAAVGTAVLPGIGTVIGAKIGSLFSGETPPAAPAKAKPPTPPAARPGNRP